MEQVIKKAMSVGLINEPATEIWELWNKLGRPESPGGPSTETKVPVTFLPDYTDDLTPEQVEEFNDAMVTLLETTGRRYVGSGIWYSDWELGTDAWIDYQNGTMDIALDFISQDMWDRYCDSL